MSRWGEVHQTDAYMTAEGAGHVARQSPPLSISLDGFATGEGQAPDARSVTPAIGSTSGCSRPDSWSCSSPATDAAGTVGVDNAFAERHEHGIGAEIMGAGESAPRVGRTPRSGADGGETIRRSTPRRTS